MKIACVFNFIQINDNYYIEKEDSYKFATESIAKEHDVHYFVLSETLDNVIRVHNGVTYHHELDIIGIMKSLERYNPDFFIISSYGDILTQQIIERFPRTKKLAIFVGGKIRIPPEKIDWVMMASEQMKQELVDLGYPENRVINCSFGVDTNLFKPVEQKKLFDIIYCADWRENKRQELLLKAISKLEGINCLIVGAQNSVHNSKYFSEMLQLIRRLKIQDRIFMVNRIPGACLPIWYQSSKMAIHLGLPMEGGARSPLEAMSCGLPVIVTKDCMSNTSRIEHMKEGVHTVADDRTIAQSIKILLQDNDLRETLGKQARKRVLEEYKQERMEEEFRKCIDSGPSAIKKMAKQKRIYLFGFFNYGMLADEIIRESTERQIRRINPDAIVESVVSRSIGGDIEDITNSLNSEYDLVVFCGGTWLGKLRVQYVNQIEKWHKKLKIPYIIYGAGWRGEKQELQPQDREKLHLFLNEAHKVGVRGNNSLTDLNNNGFRSPKIDVIGDPAFSMQFSEADLAETRRIFNDKQFLGVNLRIIFKTEMEQCGCHNDWETWEWLSKIYNDFVANERFFAIIHFPLTVPGKTIFTDQKAFHALSFSLNGSIHTKECYINLIPMARAIGDARFNIGTRLHFQLMSLVNGVPFLPIEYEFGKLADALSIHPEFDIFKNNIVSMDSNESFPLYSEFSDMYDRLKRANIPVIKKAVEEIREKQDRWLGNILSEVLR